MAEDALSEENMDISKLKVPDLKRELKSRGLSTSGNKTELMDRLQSALKSKLDDTAESADDLDDDLLNDDELDHEQLDATESVLTELDEQLNTSPTTNTPKRKLSESKLSSDSDSKPVKKIVLHREPSLPNDLEKKDENEDNPIADVDAKSDDDIDANEKKVVKLSELSAKERLEMRAKKFGAPTSTEAKKIARAERFAPGEGSASSTTTSTSTSISPGEPASLDALKKRAERFGGNVSKVMSSMEQQERMERRKARFGVVTSSNGTSSQNDKNDKAKQRLERFKTPVK